MAKTHAATLAQQNPIICGRRNCSRCRRWRHAVDYRWRWSRRRTNKVPPGSKTKTAKVGKTSRYKTPTIDSVCSVCRRVNQRESYRALSKEERVKIGRRANDRARLRRHELDKQIRYAKLSIERHRKFQNDKEVDITPFRMWLIGYVRRHKGDVSEIARVCMREEAELRRWIDAYVWEGGDEPHPIRSIRESKVDEMGIALDDPGLLERLYPYVEPD